MQMSNTASTGSATKNTSASVELMENATPVAKILLTFQKLESTIIAHTTVGGAINVKENLFLYETV